MAPSEIDDIFAAKGTGNPVKLPVPSSSALPTHPEKKKKKKKKKEEKEKQKEKSSKRKREVEAIADKQDDRKHIDRKVPETIVDPSVHISSSRSTINASRPPKKKQKTDKEDEGRFKDSRGSGPRRKTEEGFAIYKEDELGITDQGGDTPLCPFDCQCCV